MKTIIYTIFLISLVACQEEEIGKSCLEPPCGEIEMEAFNIVLAIEQHLNITDVVFDVNGTKTPLSFGIATDKLQFFGCWNHTENKPNPSLISTLTYKLDGNELEANIETATIVSNAMVIEFKGSSLVNYDYKPCDDTPES